MRRLLLTAASMIIILSMLSGCSLAQKFGFKSEDELQPVSSVVMNEEEAKKITDKVPLQLYFGEDGNTKLKLEVRYIDMSEAKKSANYLAGVIVKELIKGPTDSTLKPTIAKEAQLLGAINIDGGTATVNLSKEFVDKHPGGEAAAKLTIFSIVNSLTEMKEIQKVRFLINGKSQADFKGAYKFDSTFPRTASLIGKSSISRTSPKDIKSDVKASVKSTSTPKAPNSTLKPSASPIKTPAASPAASQNKSIIGSQNVESDTEEAEATYLEILE